MFFSAFSVSPLSSCHTFSAKERNNITLFHSCLCRVAEYRKGMGLWVYALSKAMLRSQLYSSIKFHRFGLKNDMV